MTLARRGPGRSVLFVCHGNICRSPYAEAVLRRLLRERRADAVHVDSMGLINPGRPSPGEAISGAARRGVDISHHRSRVLTGEAVHAATLVIVMDDMQRRLLLQRFGKHRDELLVLGDLDPFPIESRAIKDPYDGAEAVFDASYGRIDRCVHCLVEALFQDAKSL
ncbi:MAG: low molecular weight protein-tyrosine-phosphatase [Gemmatimonadaceae bacterium]